MLSATATPAVDNPSIPNRKNGTAVKLADLLPRIDTVKEHHESLSAFVRAAIRTEVARRRAVVAGELADLEAADWQTLLVGAAHA